MTADRTLAARRATSPDARLPSTSTRPHARRRDVQGLRALAVAAVVVNHLSSHPKGGFVGVDVFFVISGFLITGLLLDDVARGRSLGRLLYGFYRRRAARILPAALIVLGLTVWISGALFATSRAQDVRTDAIWSLVFAANWHFAANGTNYFASAHAVSPLQHYWSLSVEEQFYVVWPLGLFAAAVVVTKAARRLGRDTARRVATAALATVVGVLSFLFALDQTRSTPTVAYFSSLDRAWELALGALVACVAPAIRLPRVTATVTSLLGLATIVVSLFVVSGTTDFPAPAAALPCAGAAVCLVAGASRPIANPLLTNRAVVFLGDISYSVYLVHFPVIILLAAGIASGTAGYVVASLLLTLGISITLYYGVERPFIALGRGGLPAARTILRRSPTVPALTSGLALAALAAALITLVPSDDATGNARLAAVVTSLNRTDRLRPDEPHQDGPVAFYLATQLRLALRARSWPTLHPSIDQELRRQPVPSDMQFCGEITLHSDASCTIGPRNAAHTVYVVGDSTAMAYTEAYRQVLARRPDWNMRIGAAYGCPFDSVVIQNSDASVTDACGAHNAAVVADINKLRPDLVLVTNSYTDRTSATSHTVLSDQQWDAALSTELGKLRSHPRIGVVAPAPLGADPYSCYTPHSVPVDCSAQVTAQYLERAGAEKSLADHRGWVFVDAEGWFCDSVTGYCPAFAEGVPIKHDALHASYAWDDVIFPVVNEALVRTGLLPG